MALNMVRRRSTLLRSRTICNTFGLQRDDPLFLKVAVAGQYVGQILERELASTGIAAYQLALVTHIRHHQPVTPSAISSASGVPTTTLRDNIQRLVDQGLVRRVPRTDDRRS